MFEIIHELSALEESHIEDIEEYSSKLHSVVNNIKSKAYDLLDHRKIDFDSDCKVFLRQIDELKVVYVVLFISFINAIFFYFLIYVRKMNVYIYI